jgi:3-deoxy-D-manno-octulosonic-acid transferase
VGEARVVLRLVDALAAEGQAVVASTTTATGRALLRQERPDLVSGLAPLDHPWLVTRALQRLQPSQLVLVETELWPCLIQAAAAREIPVVVVSGRISDRSWPRYQRAGRWLAPTLGRLAAVGARSDLDAERFERLGVAPDRIVVTGDLKLEPPLHPPRLAADLEAAIQGPPLFVAGSTHEGEERAALDALDRAEAHGHSLALVLAPRHPQRNERVAELVRARGRSLLLRS